MKALVTPMSPEQLRELELLPCPRCGDHAPLWANFCGICAYLLNPAQYFWWLANQQKK